MFLPKWSRVHWSDGLLVLKNRFFVSRYITLIFKEYEMLKKEISDWIEFPFFRNYLLYIAILQIAEYMQKIGNSLFYFNFVILRNKIAICAHKAHIIWQKNC